MKKEDNKYVLKEWYRGRIHRKFKYPKDIDAELVPLLDVVNNIPGVRTEFCCCGHGGSGWYMVFQCSSFHMASVIENYFNGGFFDNFLDVDMLPTQKYETVCGGKPSNNLPVFIVPEIQVAVYCNPLGCLPDKERFEEYGRICKFFSQFSSVATWGELHEF